MSVYLCRHLSVFFCVCVAMPLPVCVPHLPGYHGCLSVYVLFVNSLYRCLCAFVTLSLSSHLSVSFIFLAIMVRNSGKSIVPLPSASTWVTTVEESLSLFNVWSCWCGWWWCGDRWSWSCPPRWSCPAARPLWGSGPGTSSPATPTSTWIVWTQLKKV